MAEDKEKDIFSDGVKLSVEISKETIEQISQQWEHLGICNDFIFCKVMLDEGS